MFQQKACRAFVRRLFVFYFRRSLMKIKSITGLFTVLLGLLMVFCLLTCGEMGYKQQEVLAVGDAQEPTITSQPGNSVYTLGSSITALSVTATVTDGGTLSFKWLNATPAEWEQSEGTELGTGSSYQPANLGEGFHQIYVLVTNTNNGVQGAKTKSARSSLIRIIINDPLNALYPTIDAEPQNTYYEWSGSLDIQTIPVTAGTTDGGTLSYQWYKADSYTNEGGAVVNAGVGGTTDSYQPAITQAGTYYYYVVVKNTNNGATGRKTSSTPSNPVIVQAITPDAIITVEPETTYQYIRGFGGQAVAWGNFPQDSLDDYERMYNPTTGLGYNILRIMIPSGDTDAETGIMGYVRNETTGDKDRSHYFDMVKKVNSYGGYVLASPWSPPAEWKTNDSTVGGQGGADAKLKTAYYNQYAAWLKQYCQVMRSNGAPIYAVSIQNEPNYKASYDGCEWDPNDMRDFLKQVGNFTGVAGTSSAVKGWGGGAETPRVLIMNGESANTPSINNAAMNDETSRNVINLIGRHNYGSTSESYYNTAKSYGKEVWMTEHNINSQNEAGYPNDSTYNYIWRFMNSVDATIRLNNESAFIWWALKRFYSMIGDGQYGTVDGAILPRGYGLSHYAKYATGFTRIAVTGKTSSGAGLSNFNSSSFVSEYNDTSARATAFVSADGNTISYVMFTPTNTGGTGGVSLGTVKIQLPEDFIIASATGVRSSKDGFFRTETVSVLTNKNAAFVELPVGHIVSIKFTKQP
jgi:O-glycosyl hydrolase